MQGGSSTKDDAPLDTDAQRALEIRFKFRDFEYTFIWSCLQAAGWTYRGSALSVTGYQYHAPGQNGQTFDSWELVVDYLDQFALPDVYGTLQLDVSKEDFQTTEEIEKAMELRRQALQKVFKCSKDQRRKITAEQGGDEGDDDDDDGEGEGEGEEDGHVGFNRTALQARRSKSSSNLTSTTQTDVGTELYLQGNKPSRQKRSGAVIDSVAKLELPTIAKVSRYLQSNESLNTQAKERENEHKRKFSLWRFLLSTNHSLLFFGAGSKHDLLSDFADEELRKEGYVLQVDGFDKDATMARILDLLVSQFLNGREPESRGRIERHDGTHHVVGESNPWRAPDLVERAILVSRACAYEAGETLLPIFLVIHSLDGESLRNKVSLDALAALIVNSTVENNVRAIRLITSIDHIAAPELIFTTQVSSDLAWIFLPVHTHRIHWRELRLLPDRNTKSTRNKLEQSHTERVKRVEEVLELLAPRHTEVMQVLSRLQLELKADDGWVKMPAFRKQCKESHVIAKDSGLDSFLNELKDHGLVEIDRNNKAGDFIRAPFDRQRLQQIITFRSSQGVPDG